MTFGEKHLFHLQVNLIRRMIYGTRDYDRLRGVNICSTYKMQGLYIGKNY